jgi:polyisoprenoid-binding protein YceI
MNEFLKGVSTFVVGTSTQLTGNITVDTAKPAQIKIGAIKLDATSLITDNAMRNKNIVNLIFKSNQPQNQFIVFQPTKVSGVPTVLTPGQSFPVKIIGDLTISGTTKPATFTGTINWRGDGTVVGTATTEVTYANFGLVIPNFPFLSNIDKVAKLEVDVTAAPVQ